MIRYSKSMAYIKNAIAPMTPTTTMAATIPPAIAATGTLEEVSMSSGDGVGVGAGPTHS